MLDMSALIPKCQDGRSMSGKRLPPGAGDLGKLGSFEVGKSKSQLRSTKTTIKPLPRRHKRTASVRSNSSSTSARRGLTGLTCASATGNAGRKRTTTLYIVFGSHLYITAQMTNALHANNRS